MEMPKAPSLSSMSVDALLNLRDDIGKVLDQKAVQLEDQLSKLGAEVGGVRRGRGSAMKGKKVPVKYRDKEGNTWAGRGAQPVWAARETQGWCEAERLCRSKDSSCSQGFPEESKEAPTQEVTRAAAGGGSEVLVSSFSQFDLTFGHIRTTLLRGMRPAGNPAGTLLHLHREPTTAGCITFCTTYSPI
jgi:hypothetical protein